MNKWMLVLLLCVFVSNGCDTDSSPAAPDGASALQVSNTNNIFSDGLGGFEVIVYYEAGADPYTGNIGATATPVWDITRLSLTALFQNHVGRYLAVPTAIGQMIQIADQKKTTWNASLLNELGEKTAPALMDGRDARLSIIFVNGLYNNNPDILGIHFKGARYAFIFKDVVTAAGGDAVAQRYAEQATVLHELGHAMGLVNNGVPMSEAHEDGAHPGHSSNPDCVMHRMLESKAGVLGAIGPMVSGNRTNLFGPQTLQDARTYHP